MTAGQAELLEHHLSRLSSYAQKIVQQLRGHRWTYKWQIMAQNNNDHSGFCEPLGCVCKHLQPVKTRTWCPVKCSKGTPLVFERCLFFYATLIIFNLFNLVSFAQSCSLTSPTDSILLCKPCGVMVPLSVTVLHGNMFWRFSPEVHTLAFCNALLVLCT